MLEVTKAEYEDEYRIRCEFNNGKSGIADLKDSLWGPVFESLKEFDKFREFRLSPEFGTIVWPNGADIAPEALADPAARHPVYPENKSAKPIMLNEKKGK